VVVWRIGKREKERKRQVFFVKRDNNCTNLIVVVWRIGKREKERKRVFSLNPR